MSNLTKREEIALAFAAPVHGQQVMAMQQRLAEKLLTHEEAFDQMRTATDMILDDAFAMADRFQAKCQRESTNNQASDKEAD